MCWCSISIRPIAMALRGSRKNNHSSNECSKLRKGVRKLARAVRPRVTLHSFSLKRRPKKLIDPRLAAAGSSKWGTDQAVGQPSVVAFRFKVEQASGTRAEAFALSAGGRSLGWRQTQL